ncbi:MAG: sugar phosphate isomerase/epimerase family protein [Planctomycetota bacterium]
MIRLGAPLVDPPSEPGPWAKAAVAHGYRAVYGPITWDDPRARDDQAIEAYVDAANQSDLLIGEVGVWHVNLIDPEPRRRDEAVEAVTRGLALADRMDATACVCLAGSRSHEAWWLPHPDNLGQQAFDLLVRQVRRIIDTVRPTRASLAIEPMPWTIPVDVDQTLALVAAVDREQFGVHLDLANWIDSPRVFLDHHRLIDDAIQRLGPKLVGVHLKDVRLEHDLPAHLRECAPGEGQLDLAYLLSKLSALPQKLPVLLEHLDTQAQYDKAFAFITSITPESVDRQGPTLA